MATNTDPTLSLRIPAELLARIDAAAEELGISKTAWLRQAAEDKLTGLRALADEGVMAKAIKDRIVDGMDKVVSRTVAPMPRPPRTSQSSPAPHGTPNIDRTLTPAADCMHPSHRIFDGYCVECGSKGVTSKVGRKNSK